MRILEVTFVGHPDASKSIGRFGVHDAFTFDQSVISSEDGWFLFSMSDGREVLINKDCCMSMIYYDTDEHGNVVQERRTDGETDPD